MADYNRLYGTMRGLFGETPKCAHGASARVDSQGPSNLGRTP